MERETLELETLTDVKAWFLQRAEWFSHGGQPWGAMGHESRKAAQIVAKAIIELAKLKKGATP